MSIIIRGMEMPKTCIECKLRHKTMCLPLCQSFALRNHKADAGRLQNCPLVPLPGGHGKIIDGDALWENMTVEQSEAFQKGLAGTIELFEMLEAAIPIVPAEGDTNE